MRKEQDSGPVFRSNPLAEIGDDEDCSRWDCNKTSSVPQGGSGVMSSFSLGKPFRSRRWKGPSDSKQISDSSTGKPRRDRFRVEAALQRLGPRGHRKSKGDSKSQHNLDISGATVTDSGHLTGSRADKLAMFEAEHFDVEVFARAHISALTEKGVAILRADLNTLDAECAKEVNGTVHEHYTTFIEACQGIAALEGSMQKLKDMMSVNSLLVGNMRDITAAAQPKAVSPSLCHKLFDESDREQTLNANQTTTIQDRGPCRAKKERLNDAFAELDVAIAERRMQKSSEIFQIAHDLVLSISSSIIHSENSQTCSANKVSQIHPDPICIQGRLETFSLQSELETRRQRLMTFLDEQIQEPTCSDDDFNNNIKSLATLAGRPRAAHSMLSAYSAALHGQQAGLLPLVSGIQGPNSGYVDYAGALCQLTFKSIGDCIEEYQRMFGDSKLSMASLFVAWAAKEVERCGNLLQRHALSAHPPDGLLASAQCIAVALAYCCNLEKHHGFCLRPHLTKNLWPALANLIHKRFRRISDEIKKMVAEELTKDRLPTYQTRKEGGEVPLASSLVLSNEIQGLISDVSFQMLNTPQLAHVLRQGISDLFEIYTTTVSRTLKKRRNKEVAMVPHIQDVTFICDIVKEIAHTILPNATSGFCSMFGQLSSMTDFQRHIEVMESTLQASLNSRALSS